MDVNQKENLATGVTLSDSAANKVMHLLAREDRDDLTLRLAVQPGGCAGLRYQLFFDNRELDGDHLYYHEQTGVAIAVDRMSDPYVQGSVVDYYDTVEQQGFKIDNPNAAGSCACGDSFN